MDLNQVTIEVLEFESSVAFYEQIGLRLIVSARGEYARFELPSGSSTLSLHRSDHPSIGGSLLYFEVDDVGAKFSELTSLGVQFEAEPKDQNWRWREVRFSDPSGNKLCLYHAGIDRRFPPWRIESE